ncbi:MAG: cytochrome c maturation protein CcmE [Rubricoccaceae bacterium]|nr:cytochrome c maturation protein CcmE [Rubricoccaceae bacterium]
MRTKTLLGLGFLAVFGFLVVSSFGEQVGGYEAFAEAAESGRTAHVVGVWLEDRPTTYDPAANQFSFWMADEEGAVRRVVYPNPKPANFEDAEQVVVNGRMAGEVFAADHILVKCPSKYNDERGLEGMTQETALE